MLSFAKFGRYLNTYYDKKKVKAICTAIGSADRQVSALTTSLSVQKFVYLHCQINGINGFPHGSAETCLSALLKIGGGRMKGSRRGGEEGRI